MKNLIIIIIVLFSFNTYIYSQSIEDVVDMNKYNEELAVKAFMFVYQELKDSLDTHHGYDFVETKIDDYLMEIANHHTTYMNLIKNLRHDEDIDVDGFEELSIDERKFSFEICIEGEIKTNDITYKKLAIIFMNGWLSSPPHRSALLDEDYGLIGLSFKVGENYQNKYFTIRGTINYNSVLRKEIIW